MFDSIVVEEQIGKLVGADVALAMPEELLDAALAFERMRSLLEVAEAHVLARLDGEGIVAEEFGLSTAGWLACTAKQPSAACRRRVRTARALGDHLEVLDEAVQDGELSYAHVEVVAGAMNSRNTDAVAAVQGTLVDLAAELRFDPWARAVRDIANTLDQDGGYDPNDDVHANRLHFTEMGDRTMEAKGRLVGELAAVVPQVLGQVADDLFRQYAADHTADPSLLIPSRATLMALALEEVCRRAMAVDMNASRQPRTEAVYVIELNRDRDRVAAPDGQLLPGGGLEALRCDERLRALLLDSLGNPVALGHRTDLVTPDQRRALTVRDGGCIFPGCDRPPGWCDAHHVIHRKHGGTTELENLGLLCRRHHGVVHRTGWTMTADPDRPQQFLITTPTGRILRTRRHRGLSA